MTGSDEASQSCQIDWCIRYTLKHTHTLFITSKEHDEDGGWPAHVTNNWPIILSRV